MMQTINCPLCESQSRKQLFSFESGIGISQCQNCDFIYTSPRLDKTERERLYSSGYFNGNADTNMDINYIENASIFENDATERYQFIKEFLPNSKWRILELGAAAGFFLNECKKHGHETTGIELSSDMCDYARRHFGVNCIQGRMENAELQNSYFDAAALWHVLEHMEEPLETVKLLYEKIIKGGFIFISVPNICSGNAIRKGAQWHHLQPQVHLNHFSPESLKKFLDIAGFELIKMLKTGSTGLLGRSSQIPNVLKSSMARYIKQLNWMRKTVKFFLSNCLRKDDFITVIGKKR